MNSNNRSDTLQSVFKICILTCTLLLFTGCAQQYVEKATPQQFKQSKDSVGVVSILHCSDLFIVNCEKGDTVSTSAKYMPTGSIGLLDAAIILSAIKPIATELEKVPLPGKLKENYYDLYAKALKNEGLNPVVAEQPLFHGDLKLKSEDMYQHGEGPSGQFRKYEFDLKPVAEELGVDYLLVLDVLFHGAARSYMSVVPSNDPKGHTMARLYLYDRQSDSILSDRMASPLVDVDDPWDQPGSYSNLKAAVDKALYQALDELFVAFFGYAP